jgi:hypothetical protein
MRADTYKVIVERPRRHKEGDAAAARLRNDIDGPTRLSMRAGYGYRELNENLAPLRRYLNAQVGRLWNKVFSEICAGIDSRNTVQQHIHQHIRDFIAIDVEVRDGRLVDLADRCSFFRNSSGLAQRLYVDPRTGLIRLNRNYRSWRLAAVEQRKRERAAIAARRRVVGERTLLLLLGDAWFSVEVAELPEETCIASVVNGQPHRRMTAESRYDVVLQRSVSRTRLADTQQCEHLYGSRNLFAVSRRQISTREIRAHGLRKATA